MPSSNSNQQKHTKHGPQGNPIGHSSSNEYAFSSPASNSTNLSIPSLCLPQPRQTLAANDSWSLLRKLLQMISLFILTLVRGIFTDFLTLSLISSYRFQWESSELAYLWTIGNIWGLEIKWLDTVATIEKNPLDDWMGFAQLGYLKEVLAEHKTQPCIVWLGFDCFWQLWALAKLRGNGQIVNFQFPIQYELFLQPYLLWCFSNYNKFAFFWIFSCFRSYPKDAIRPWGNMPLCAHIMLCIGFPSST